MNGIYSYPENGMYSYPEMFINIFRSKINKKIEERIKIDVDYDIVSKGKMVKLGFWVSPSYSVYTFLHIEGSVDVNKSLNEILDLYADKMINNIFDYIYTWVKIAQLKYNSLKEIMTIQDIEQRMFALKVLGLEKILEEANAKLIDKSEKGNELYRVDGVFSKPAYFLKYKDKSTDRIYISGIPPEIGRQGSADKCMAWKFQISLKQYYSLKGET